MKLQDEMIQLPFDSRIEINLPVEIKFKEDVSIYNGNLLYLDMNKPSRLSIFRKSTKEDSVSVVPIIHMEMFNPAIGAKYITSYLITEIEFIKFL